ncbi:FtsH-binding integral membrane protein [Bradyrhizobium diazoefficiens]|uniref:BAX inhibitor (BI)-1/YccA family protein n=1 Tax=Bradyrhizobium diazoefficiens TaxID=1355477 RepID=A0A0E4BSE3_9BRAD|nr:hypothetical protein NK6_5856 [Bradyrhizobium diazoefficiens]
MSNYDQNLATSDAIAVDAGLRGYMLRIYNYMAAGVGLTAVVAWLTYQLTGPALLQSPLMWVFILAPLALVFFISARIKYAVGGDGAASVLHLCRAGRGLALDTAAYLHQRLDHARVFHRGRDVRSAQRIRLHHKA